jgi:hypothetical protein
MNATRRVKTKKSFVDFMVDAEADRALAMEFLLYSDPNDLQTFFDNKGYSVTMDEIVKILKLRTKLASRTSLQCIDDYY